VLAVGTAMAAEDRLRGAVEPVTAKKPYRIGVTLVHFVDDYWKGISYGLVEEAKHANVEIVRLLAAGGYGRVADQIAQLETISTLDLDAVILGATNYDGYDRAIQRLIDKGIKVVAAGVPVNSKLVALGVTMDEIAIGRTLAQFACKAKSNAKVATIPGPNGPAWNKLRFDGFQAGAKDCPGMELVGNIFKGDTKIEDGQSQGSDLLIKYPDADYIYAAAANLGTGAALAAKRMDRPAKVITATVTSKTVELMKEGRISMVISEPGILIGRSLIQYTTRLLNGDALPNLVDGGPIPYKQFLIPLYELTNDNVGGYELTVYDQPPSGWQVPASQ
jgi:ribose transport system substrate-binding protein